MSEGEQATTAKGGANVYSSENSWKNTSKPNTSSNQDYNPFQHSNKGYQEPGYNRGCGGGRRYRDPNSNRGRGSFRGQGVQGRDAKFNQNRDYRSENYQGGGNQYGLANPRGWSDNQMIHRQQPRGYQNYNKSIDHILGKKSDSSLNLDDIYEKITKQPVDKQGMSAGAGQEKSNSDKKNQKKRFDTQRTQSNDRQENHGPRPKERPNESKQHESFYQYNKREQGNSNNFHHGSKESVYSGPSNKKPRPPISERDQDKSGPYKKHPMNRNGINQEYKGNNQRSLLHEISMVIVQAKSYPEKFSYEQLYQDLMAQKPVEKVVVPEKRNCKEKQKKKFVKLVSGHNSGFGNIPKEFKRRRKASRMTVLNRIRQGLPIDSDDDDIDEDYVLRKCKSGTEKRQKVTEWMERLRQERAELEARKLLAENENVASLVEVNCFTTESIHSQPDPSSMIKLDVNKNMHILPTCQSDKIPSSSEQTSSLKNTSDSNVTQSVDSIVNNTEAANAIHRKTDQTYSSDGSFDDSDNEKELRKSKAHELSVNFSNDLANFISKKSKNDNKIASKTQELSANSLNERFNQINNNSEPKDSRSVMPKDLNLSDLKNILQARSDKYASKDDLGGKVNEVEVMMQNWHLRGANDKSHEILVKGKDGEVANPTEVCDNKTARVVQDDRPEETMHQEKEEHASLLVIKNNNPIVFDKDTNNLGADQSTKENTKDNQQNTSAIEIDEMTTRKQEIEEALLFKGPPMVSNSLKLNVEDVTVNTHLNNLNYAQINDIKETDTQSNTCKENISRGSVNKKTFTTAQEYITLEETNDLIEVGFISDSLILSGRKNEYFDIDENDDVLKATLEEIEDGSGKYFEKDNGVSLVVGRRDEDFNVAIEGNNQDEMSNKIEDAVIEYSAGEESENSYEDSDEEIDDKIKLIKVLSEELRASGKDASNEAVIQLLQEKMKLLALNSETDQGSSKTTTPTQKQPNSTTPRGPASNQADVDVIVFEDSSEDDEDDDDDDDDLFPVVIAKDKQN